MWYCPNCGEQIDDAFDACWKCGTAQNGTLATDFQAEPSNSDALDTGAQPGQFGESAEDSPAASVDWKNERIIELCSAANAIEAYALSGLLAEAGIQSRIVGESLGNAAGLLPLGETIAPRIWVREKDAACAQEIIDEQTRESCQEMSSLAEGDEQTAFDAASDDDDVPRASGVPFSWLREGLSFIGLACILCGIIWASYAWATMHKYAATTEGVATQYRRQFSVDSVPSSDLPIPSIPPTISHWYEVQYAFVVDGKTYYASAPNCPQVVPHMPIHYDPHHPEENIVGQLTRPWLVLFFALGIGAWILFVGHPWRWCENEQNASGVRTHWGRLGIVILSLTCILITGVWATRNGAPGPSRAAVLIRKADLLLRKKDYVSAISTYNEAIQLTPDSAPAFCNRGTAYAKKGDLDKAIADYTEALRLDPKIAIAHCGRGICYLDKGQPDNTIVDCTEAIRLDPKLARAYCDRGTAYLDKAQFDKAIADYTAAIRLDPKLTPAYNNRGNAWCAKGKYDKAIADCTETIRLDSNYALAYKNRGNAWRAKGEYDKAIEDYTQAIRLNPKNGEAYYGRGWAYKEKGDEPKAKEDLAQASKLGYKPK